MARQASFRWREEDDPVVEALAQYAVSGNQAEVIRLALWRLLYPAQAVPDTLLTVARMFDTPPQYAPPQPPSADVLAALADMSARIAALEARPASQADTRDVWRVIQDLKEQITALSSGIPDEPRTALDDETERQRTLSAKLKGISFAKLQ